MSQFYIQQLVSNRLTNFSSVILRWGRPFGLCFLTGLLLLVGTVLHAQTIVYTASLSGPAQSPPTASTGTGSATVTIDNTASTMRVQVTFSGLSGTTTAAHIHGPTSTANSGLAGVMTTTPSFLGFPSGVTSGTYDNTFDMTLASSYNPTFVTANGGTVAAAFAALKAALAGEKAYFNIHTAPFPGGEIRGFLIQNPSSPPTLTVSATTVCPGSPISVTATCASGTASFSSSPAAGSVNGNIYTYASNTASGSYTLSATCTNANGSSSATTTNVYISPSVAADAISLTASELLGPNNCSVTLKATGFGNSFIFTGPGGYVFSAVYRQAGFYTVNALDVKQPGTYTLTVMYTNTCGISSTDTMAYVVGGQVCN